MKAKHLMIFGAAVGIGLSFIGILAPRADIMVPIFAAGAMFGKGYGIFEERSRKQKA